MSHHRFTIKELSEMSDVQFISILLNERQNDCTNSYSPMSLRLKVTINRLEQGDLIGYIPKKGPAINDKVKTLLLNACKTFGANVDNIMSYIGEQLTTEEYQDAKAFLTWSFTNKKFFGHGNIDERYTQFKKKSK